MVQVVQIVQAVQKVQDDQRTSMFKVVHEMMHFACILFAAFIFVIR